VELALVVPMPPMPMRVAKVARARVSMLRFGTPWPKQEGEGEKRSVRNS